MTIDFGTRQCKLCPEAVPTELYGRHVIREHDVAEWPGGEAGFLVDLRASLQESVRRAEGNKEVLDHLQTSLQLIEKTIEVTERFGRLG